MTSFPKYSGVIPLIILIKFGASIRNEIHFEAVHKIWYVYTSVLGTTGDAIRHAICGGLEWQMLARVLT